MDAHRRRLDRRATDIAARTRALGTPEQRAHTAVIEAADPVLGVDRSGTIVFANPAAESLFGGALTGRNVAELLRTEDPSPAARTFSQLISSGEPRVAAVAQTPDGGGRQVEVTVGAPHPARRTLVLHEQVDLGVSIPELLRRATQDDLTRLMNRTHFNERAATLAGPEPHAPGQALALLDLDGFKRINDSLGHDAGDRVLVEIARRLRRVCRSDDLIARLGGDEFAIWCTTMADAASQRRFGRRVLAAVELPIVIGHRTVRVSGSLGVVSSTYFDGSIGRLLTKADTAMFQAKELGKGQCVVFDRGLEIEMDRLWVLERGLSGAADRGELEMWYQPVADVATGTIIGAEALARWQHPDLGLLGPDDFLPLAAQSGVLAELGNHLIGDAVRAWFRAAPPDLTLSVNVATSQLSDELVSDLRQLVDDQAMDPCLLVIELSEEVLLDSSISHVAALEPLRGLGVRLALDRFGTASSSLASLRHLPIDQVKIDGSLVSGIARSHRRMAIVRSILGLAAALELETVATGVETDADLDVLRDLGCDLAQGFVVGAPSRDVPRSSLRSA